MKKKSVWRVLALGVGVVVIFGVIGVMLIDPIVKWQIEKRGTQSVGARVELAQADVSFLPLGVTLTDLQVTDPNAPMTNAVQVDRINATVEFGPLLQRKVIIEEMAMERARFSTPRSTSGAVPGRGSDKTPEAAQACQGSQLPFLGIPDIDKILEKARLASLSRVAALQDQVDRQQAAWTSRLGALPGPETFDAYRQRIEKFTSGSQTSVAALLGAPAELQSLQKDLQRDLDLLKNAQKELSGEIDTFNGHLAKIKGLAANDVDDLVKEYGLTRGDLKHISQALLGDTFCGWVAQALDWYDRIKPLLQGRAGAQQTARTKPTSSANSNQTEEVLPDFLIRKAVVSVELKSGTISGGLRNVTTDQAILGQPTAFYLSGEKLDGVDLVQINGVLDHVRPNSTQDTLDLLMRGLALENFAIPTGTGLPLTVNRALAELQLTSSLHGDTIEAVLKTGLTDALIALARTGDADPIGDIMASVIGELRQVDVAAMVNGTVRDYTMKIESGLDQALAPALSNVVQKQTTILREKLSAGIAEQVTPAMRDVRASLEGFGAIERELAARFDLGEDMIQNLVRSF